MDDKKFLLLEAEAIKFVEEHHRPQSYGDFPYSVHLHHINAIAKEFGLNRDVQLATFLHDLFEDTFVSKKKVIEKFGERVARIVYLVTDEKGWTRREKHTKTYPAIAEDKDATAVKFCDRIGNVRFGLATENYSKVGMYASEYDNFMSYFRDTIKTHPVMLGPLKAELDRLRTECLEFLSTKPN